MMAVMTIRMNAMCAEEVAANEKRQVSNQHTANKNPLCVDPKIKT
jgi:hypothetical protein